MTEKLSELLRSQNTIPLSAPDTTKGDKADKEIVDRLKMELQKFKQDTKGSNDSLSSAVKELEEKMKTANKYLPPLVKSTRHQLLHKNNKVLIYAPACMWKTICGWHYYSANYTFEEGEDSKVSCAKCQLSAQQQGGQVCWQLADLSKLRTECPINGQMCQLDTNLRPTKRMLSRGGQDGNFLTQTQSDVC